MSPNLPFSEAGNADSIQKSGCWDGSQIANSQLVDSSMPVETNQQASPQILLPANYSHLVEPALRADYMGSGSGRTHSYPRPFPLSYTHVMHETVQREIEKQQIREEIIMSEIFRRRDLEAEVRQEMMMERKLALLRGQNSGIPTGSSTSSLLEFESPTMLPVLGTGGERSLEERIILSLAEKERLKRGHEGGGFGTMPFQGRSDYPRVSHVRPAVSEMPKEKRKIVLLDKPDEDIVGLNKKASIPSVGLDSSEKDGGMISCKKAKSEWFCSVCQLSATSEQALNEHLQGKKHKSKEVTVRAQRSGKNYSMGLFPKNATKSIVAQVTPDSSSTSGSPQPPLLTENVNSDNLKKDTSVLVVVQEVQKKDDQEKDQNVVPEVQKKEESKKNRFRFWCEMCQVGSNAKKIFKAHNNGRKHARRLEAGIRNAFHDREKVVVLVNREGFVVDRDGKNVASVDVDEALEEADQENHDLVDENKEGCVAVECADDK